MVEGEGDRQGRKKECMRTGGRQRRALFEKVSLGFACCCATQRIDSSRRTISNKLLFRCWSLAMFRWLMNDASKSSAMIHGMEADDRRLMVSARDFLRGSEIGCGETARASRGRPVAANQYKTRCQREE